MAFSVTVFSQPPFSVVVTVSVSFPFLQSLPVRSSQSRHHIIPSFPAIFSQPTFKSFPLKERGEEGITTRSSPSSNATGEGFGDWEGLGPELRCPASQPPERVFLLPPLTLLSQEAGVTASATGNFQKYTMPRPPQNRRNVIQAGGLSECFFFSSASDWATHAFFPAWEVWLPPPSVSPRVGAGTPLACLAAIGMPPATLLHAQLAFSPVEPHAAAA